MAQIYCDKNTIKQLFVMAIMIMTMMLIATKMGTNENDDEINNSPV